MIQIRNLNKKFQEVDVLHDINMHFERGKIYGLIGQSGSGKSTLLRCINGLIPYNGGSLQMNGVEVSELSGIKLREFRKNIGMIFQSFSLLNRLNVFDNIALPLQCWGYSKKDIEKRVTELMEMVHISEKRTAYPRELSGGQKQRVAIARALALNPKILLCDEATSALDPNIAETIMSLLVEINQALGITVIVVTHQFSVVKRYCEEVFVLSCGKIAASGKCSFVFSDPPNSLQAIMSGIEQINYPTVGKTIQIVLPADLDSACLVSKISMETNIVCAILSAVQNRYADMSVTTLLINVAEEHFQTIAEYLDKSSVKWQVKDSIQ